MAQIKGKDTVVRQSYKMVDERDLVAANALLELAYGVVPIQTGNSFEINKCGTSELKLRFPLPKASFAKRNKRKRDQKDDSSRDAEVDMENYTDKPTSVKKKLQSEKAKVGAGSLNGWKDDIHSEHKLKALNVRF